MGAAGMPYQPGASLVPPASNRCTAGGRRGAQEEKKRYALALLHQVLRT